MFPWLLSHPVGFGLALFAALMLSLGVGRLLGQRRRASDPDATGTSAI